MEGVEGVERVEGVEGVSGDMLRRLCRVQLRHVIHDITYLRFSLDIVPVRRGLMRLRGFVKS